jgi:G6PDH family F420-dependent oxidoreductase
MLEEARELIRLLWQGETTSCWGDHYAVEDARSYTLPHAPPPIMVAGSGPNAIAAAGRLGDGFIGLAPETDTIEQFEEAGGGGKPRYGQVTVCWAEDLDDAHCIVAKTWPTSGLTGEMTQELRTVAHFEQAVAMLSKEQRVEHIACGPDPMVHLESIYKFVNAGYDHVYIHQIGPDQEGFFRFFEQELLPQLH